MIMDLRHLRYFMAVAEEMHFGRAAARLGISQPPLSQQIRALEQELGVQLFDRTSRRVRLTTGGELFLPQARQTLLQAERAMLTAKRAQMGEIGHLALGITASAPFVPVVSRALYQFRQIHPEVELRLQEMGRDDQIAAIERDLIDIAIIRDADRPLLPTNLTATRLIEESMVLAVRGDHPLAARAAEPGIPDLRDEPLVLYSTAAGAGFNEHLYRLCQDAGFWPRVVYEASGLATLLGLVAAGFGSTILSQSLARLHVENLVYRQFADLGATRLWLIHKATPAPCARMFTAIVQQTVQDDQLQQAPA
jgi:DNA-binding transcriptional LysR family regulator